MSHSNTSSLMNRQFTTVSAPSLRNVQVSTFDFESYVPVPSLVSPAESKYHTRKTFLVASHPASSLLSASSDLLRLSRYLPFRIISPVSVAVYFVSFGVRIDLR